MNGGNKTWCRSSAKTEPKPVNSIQTWILALSQCLRLWTQSMLWPLTITKRCSIQWTHSKGKSISRLISPRISCLLRFLAVRESFQPSRVKQCNSNKSRHKKTKQRLLQGVKHRWRISRCQQKDKAWERGKKVLTVARIRPSPISHQSRSQWRHQLAAWAQV